MKIAPPLALVAAVVLALSTAAAALASPLPASVAADGDTITWSVAPAATANGTRATFEYAVDPGTQINDTVVITNSGPTATDFTVYATDATNDFETGGLGLLAGDEKPTDLGSWILLDIESIRLEPGTEAIVPFTLLIPSDASPGDHSAGIVASSITTSEEDGQAVQLDQRVGARVNLRVAGDIAVETAATGLVAGFSPSWNPFAPGTVEVDYAVANNGNLRLDVEQVIRVDGPFGIVLATVAVEPIRNILPGQSVHVTETIPAIAALALVWGTVELQPGAVGSADAADEEEPVEQPATDGSVPVEEIEYPAATATTMTIAISWTLLVLVVIVLGLALLVVRYVRSTRYRLYDAIDAAAAEAREAGAREAIAAQDSRESSTEPRETVPTP